jgi:hypothetical protein
MNKQRRLMDEALVTTPTVSFDSFARRFGFLKTTSELTRVVGHAPALVDHALPRSRDSNEEMNLYGSKATSFHVRAQGQSHFV